MFAKKVGSLFQLIVLKRFPRVGRAMTSFPALRAVTAGPRNASEKRLPVVTELPQMMRDETVYVLSHSADVEPLVPVLTRIDGRRQSPLK